MLVVVVRYAVLVHCHLRACAVRLKCEADHRVHPGSSSRRRCRGTSAHGQGPIVRRRCAGPTGGILGLHWPVGSTAHNAAGERVPAQQHVNSFTSRFRGNVQDADAPTGATMMWADHLDCGKVARCPRRGDPPGSRRGREARLAATVPSMPTARVNGITMYYEQHGAGEPLLLINGLGFSAHCGAIAQGPPGARWQ